MRSYTADEVEAVRGAVRQAIEDDGLRPTARAVGMSACGLRKFAFGSSMPYRESWIGLVEWFDWWCGRLRRPDPADLARAADVLTGDFDGALRERIRAELLALAGHFHGIPVRLLPAAA